jgi:RIO-like serine/threonine protein kinase
MLGEQERAEVLAWIRETSDADDSCLARGHQARLHLFRGACGTFVIKVPEGKGLGLVFRRWMVRNEYRAYQRLAGLEGIARCYGLLEDRYLVLEYIDADSLATHKLSDPETFFARTLALIECFHARGVTHGDLRRRSNVLVAEGERPVIIDFGVAVLSKERSSWLRRHAFELMKRDDRHSWVKLRYKRRRLASPKDLQPESPHLIKRIRKAIKRMRGVRSSAVGRAI